MTALGRFCPSQPIMPSVRYNNSTCFQRGLLLTPLFQRGMYSFPSSSLGMQIWKLQLPVSRSWRFGFAVPKLELSSLYTSACRSLGACATRGGQALPDCQAKPDLHCRRIPNPGRNNELSRVRITHHNHARERALITLQVEKNNRF